MSPLEIFQLKQDTTSMYSHYTLKASPCTLLHAVNRTPTRNLFAAIPQKQVTTAILQDLTNISQLAIKELQSLTGTRPGVGKTGGEGSGPGVRGG